jgi:hypothetical protein
MTANPAAAVAARKAPSTIPIVCPDLNDPVRFGIGCKPQPSQRPRTLAEYRELVPVGRSSPKPAGLGREQMARDIASLQAKRPRVDATQPLA